MKRFFSFLLLLCPAFISAQSGLSPSQHLGQVNAISTAAPFQLITPDARSGALGDCGAATSADAFSMHWNPAKTAFAQHRVDVGVAYTPWLRALMPGINHAYISGFVRPKKIRGLENDKQTICASVRYFSMGEISITGPGPLGGVIGGYRPDCWSADLAYVRKLSKNFSAGMGVRYVTLYLDPNVARAHNVAVDLSAYYQKDSLLGDRMHFGVGLHLSNLGPKYYHRTPATTEDFAPANLRLGSTLRVKADDYNSFGLSADLNKLLVPSPPIYALNPANGAPAVNPATGQYVIAAGKQPGSGGVFGSFYDSPYGFEGELREITIGTGLEYWYQKMCAVRGGYFHEDKMQGNRQFITLGAGLLYNASLRFGTLGLDFCYLIPTNRQRSPLGNTLRFSLYYRFP